MPHKQTVPISLEDVQPRPDYYIQLQLNPPHLEGFKEQELRDTRHY